MLEHDGPVDPGRVEEEDVLGRGGHAYEHAPMRFGETVRLRHGDEVAPRVEGVSVTA